MAIGSQLPTIEELRSIIEYEPETGKLFWKERPVSMFRNDARWTADQACRRWNTKWSGKEAFTFTMKHGHKQGYILGKPFLAHRVAFKLFHGRDPNGEIDHINGDPSDNRIENLRDVSHQENMRNRKVRADNTSGFTGVRYDPFRNKWKALIGKTTLGRFDRIEDAILARAQGEEERGYHPNHGKR